MNVREPAHQPLVQNAVNLTWLPSSTSPSLGLAFAEAHFPKGIFCKLMNIFLPFVPTLLILTDIIEHPLNLLGLGSTGKVNIDINKTIIQTSNSHWTIGTGSCITSTFFQVLTTACHSDGKGGNGGEHLPPEPYLLPSSLQLWLACQWCKKSQSPHVRKWVIPFSSHPLHCSVPKYSLHDDDLAHHADYAQAGRGWKYEANFLHRWVYLWFPLCLRWTTTGLYKLNKNLILSFYSIVFSNTNGCHLSSASHVEGPLQTLLSLSPHNNSAT